MKYFFCKLTPPRPTFAIDMTDAERQLMHQHVAYWSELAAQGSDVGTAEFMAAWRRIADQLEEQAGEAEKAGHRRTAGQKLFRASVYVSQAERMQSAKDPGRNVNTRAYAAMAMGIASVSPGSAPAT